MTDLVLGARLNATDDGLVDQLTRAEAKARGLEGAFGEAGAGARRLDAAMDAFAKQQAIAASAIGAAKEALSEGAISQGQYNRMVIASKNDLKEYEAALREAQRAQAGSVASAGMQRAAYQQLGFQVQDITSQVALGVNPLVVLAQQGGQTASALSMMGDAGDGAKGKMVKFATFLSGPWGAAILAGTTVVGMLIQNLLDSGDAADEAGAANETLADKLDLARHSYEEVIAAIRIYNGEARRAGETALEGAQAASIEARENLKAAEAKLQNALATSRLLAASAPSSANSGKKITNSADLLAERIRGELEEIRVSIGNTTFDLATELAKIQTDPVAEITERFAGMRRELRGSTEDVEELARKLADLSRQEEAAKQTVRAARRSPSGSAERQTNVGEMVALIKELFPGVRITSTTGGRHTKGSDHYAGRAIDFVPAEGMARYSTSEVERMLEAAGVKIRYGKGGNKQIFGPGRGAASANDHADHFHVAWSGVGGGVDRYRERLAEQLADFGADAGDRISKLLGDYDPQKSGVDAALADLREIDGLVAALGERKPPGFEETIRSAGLARAAIEANLGEPIAAIAARFDEVPQDLAQASAALADLDRIENALREAEVPNLDELLGQLDEARGKVSESLTRPFAEILSGQQRSNDLLRLQVEGREDEAEELGLIHQLMEMVGAESEEQLATELAKRGVTRDMFEAMMRNLGVARQLTAEGQRRREIERAHLGEMDAFRGEIERFFADIPRKGVAALGDFAGGVQDQVADYFARYLTETLFGGVFAEIEQQLSGQAQVIEANEKQASAAINVVRAFNALESAAAGAATALDPENTITVTGERIDDEQLRMKSPRELFGTMAKELLRELGLGDLADDIGEKVGVALEGAVIGQAASSVLLGSSGNRTTASIGGALGQIAGQELTKGLSGFLGEYGGPLGGIAGGLIGSLLGGLFEKKEYGTAVLGQGQARQAGNSEAARGVAGGLGDNVEEGLNRIAEALGATVGGYKVSIGTHNGTYRVSTTGYSGGGPLNFAGDSAVGLHDFGEDKAGAVAFAIGDAIGDGAIGGVSAAVQKALRSSKDLDKAISEALKVKDLEDLLSGLADGVSEELRAFERLAEERLQIARDYGFEVAEIERVNAEERARLVEQILEDRIGSLRTLLEDLEFGDLAEGTLAERRTKLRAEIAEAEADAAAGEDGAADRLAQLNRQLVDLSRDAYGTAGGEYGADRDQAIASAERIIALEKERLGAENGELTDRLDLGNKIADEGNDILAEIRALLERGSGRTGPKFSHGLPDPADTERQVRRYD
ncbi:hypothetical protein QQS45_00005 [Alteriqipengyuania flavescens]|uniref:hypothetical protein n=1 Tax=Alteriqipengyuania flavescens TaxID=3053610 RepID=UPI0025B54926|nr:hypothetical protein [Alteriqipengyuania flavescens]WJY18673.1 hypothetical protein QQW98_00005 [Alteriqipengyuania flavescens]WJY24613.1 hypothetical protein QQS45_00005 [Alteriqipengyuania flavescens]